VKERKMVRIRYINDTPGVTNDIPGIQENGMEILVSEELAMSLVKNGKSNFYELVEKEEEAKKPKKPKKEKKEE
jgi:hypothetical protein